MSYIKREDVLEAYNEVQRRNGPWRFETLIESIPDVKVEEVIHCCDCENWVTLENSNTRVCAIYDIANSHGEPVQTKSTDYCSYGVKVSKGVFQ